LVRRHPALAEAEVRALDDGIDGDDAQRASAHDGGVVARTADDPSAVRATGLRTARAGDGALVGTVGEQLLDRFDQRALGDGRSAVSVDDPRAVEIVRRELAAHAVARKDADAKAAHLAGDVPEHDVVVVELHAEHRVRQRLDHLALEFNLVLLWH
jgi:hypothetical protein